VAVDDKVLKQLQYLGRTFHVFCDAVFSRNYNEATQHFNSNVYFTSVDVGYLLLYYMTIKEPWTKVASSEAKKT